MKGIRTTILTTAALAVAIIGLTGCSPDSHNSDFGYPQHYDEPSLVYVNSETGKITKFVDVEYVDEETTTEEVLYEENYSETDTKVEYAVYANNPSFSDSVSLATTATVEGKQYPVATNLTWEWAPMELDVQVALFNERVASGQESELLLQNNTIPALISGTIATNVRAALDQGVIPAVEYQVTGRSVTTADTRVINGWKSGTPAWQTLQEIKGTPVNSERYFYSFLCASYDVTIANKEAVLETVRTLPDAQYVSFWLDTSKSNLLVETAEPCTIQKYDGGSSTQGSSSNNPGGNTPPPPPVKSGSDGGYYNEGP